MAITRTQRLANLPEARRAKIEARTEELVVEEMTLRQLRTALGVTQTQLADKLGVSQPNVAAFEKSNDPKLSTLREYLGSLDCEFEILGKFADGRQVQISLG